MAYKFQRGVAVLSGSIKAEEGLDSNTAGLANAGAIAGATTIDASGDLTVGSITMSEFTVNAGGDTDIDGTLNVEGVPTFQAGAVFSGGITTANAIAGATTISGSGNISSGGSFLGQGIGLADASGIAGTGIDNNNGELQPAASQTLISSLKHDSLVVGRATGNDHIDFASAGTVAIETNNIARLSVTDATSTFSNDLVVAGNLTVQGTTTTVDSTTINISSSFTFEGPADDNETVLSCGTPAGDLTVLLPQYAATETIHLAALADAPTADSCDVTAAEFALLRGASSVDNTVTLANGDGVLYNDGGSMKQVDLRRFTAKFAGNGIAATDLEMNLDINGLAGSKTTVAQNDLIAIADSADSNIVKKVTLSNFEDEIFGNISGQAGVAAGGVLSLNVAAITGQTEMTGDVADADELLINDGGALKRVDFSVFRDAVFNDVSGDASIEDGGALTIAAGAVEHGMLAENIISGQNELALGDIDGADEILVHDADANEVKRYGIDNLRTFINAGAAPTEIGDANATLAVGLNFSTNRPTTERTLTLPASPAVGQSVKVKANSNMSDGTYKIAKDGGTSHTIDGEDFIVLESANAAVELVYAKANTWLVF